jgi:hypothetical protein
MEGLNHNVDVKDKQGIESGGSPSRYSYDLYQSTRISGAHCNKQQQAVLF